MTQNIDSKRPLFRASVDTQTLVKVLLTVIVGGTITYDELSEAIGMNIHFRISSLQSSRRILIGEHRILFETIRGVGLRRMESAGVVDCLKSEIKRVGRAAARGIKKSTCAIEAELTPEQHLSFLSSQSMLIMQQAAARVTNQRRLENKVKTVMQVLPYGHTLAALQGRTWEDTDEIK